MWKIYAIIGLALQTGGLSSAVVQLRSTQRSFFTGWRTPATRFGRKAQLLGRRLIGRPPHTVVATGAAMLGAMTASAHGFVQPNRTPPADDAPMSEWGSYVKTCVADLRGEIADRDNFRAAEAQRVREHLDRVETRAAEDTDSVRQELRVFAGGTDGQGLNMMFWSLLATAAGAVLQTVAVVLS